MKIVASIFALAIALLVFRKLGVHTIGKGITGLFILAMLAIGLLFLVRLGLLLPQSSD